LPAANTRGTVESYKHLYNSPTGGTMTLILASRTNVYSGSPLARVGEKREDEAWIEAALHNPDSLFVPVWRARSLIRQGEEGTKPEAVFLTGEAARELHMAGGPWSFLGLREGRAVFAVDVSHVDDPLPLLSADIAKFVDLRNVGSAIGNDDASVLAHARGLMHWRVKHRFCGVCGAPCEAKTAGHMMLCTACNTQHFPRSDPAVIMLIHQGDRALLGHSTRFPNARMYSTLAGFVEPGETLEEAVRREVMEEVGVSVGDVFYHSSQPWPFPANIMLGFYGEALSEDITIDPTELKDARWFSRDEMRNCDAHGFQLPRLDSIARRLIEDWLAAG
jgi:NAD+ diphosphatase